MTRISWFAQNKFEDFDTFSSVSLGGIQISQKEIGFFSYLKNSQNERFQVLYYKKQKRPNRGEEDV